MNQKRRFLYEWSFKDISVVGFENCPFWLSLIVNVVDSMERITFLISVFQNFCLHVRRKVQCTPRPSQLKHCKSTFAHQLRMINQKQPQSSSIPVFDNDNKQHMDTDGRADARSRRRSRRRRVVIDQNKSRDAHVTQNATETTTTHYRCRVASSHRKNLQNQKGKNKHYDLPFIFDPMVHRSVLLPETVHHVHFPN